MKKLFSLICVIAVGVMSIGGVVRANPEFPKAHALGVRDPKVGDFIENRIIKNEDRFIYDEKRRNKITDEFDAVNEVYQGGKLFVEAQTLHANGVSTLLSEGKDVRYNDAALADWVFHELRSRGVECEELTISWCDEFIYSFLCDMKLISRYAVLIPQVVAGTTHWYVCDVAAMSRAKKSGAVRYRKFLFCPLKDYLDSYGEAFFGAVVSDRAYVLDGRGKRMLGGRNLFCWLSQNGHSAFYVVDMLKNSPMFNNKFAATENYYQKDLNLFAMLRQFAGLPAYKICPTILW